MTCVYFCTPDLFITSICIQSSNLWNKWVDSVPMVTWGFSAEYVPSSRIELLTRARIEQNEPWESPVLKLGVPPPQISNRVV